MNYITKIDDIVENVWSEDILKMSQEKLFSKDPGNTFIKITAEKIDKIKEELAHTDNKEQLARLLKTLDTMKTNKENELSAFEVSMTAVLLAVILTVIPPLASIITYVIALFLGFSVVVTIAKINKENRNYNRAYSCIEIAIKELRDDVKN